MRALLLASTLAASLSFAQTSRGGCVADDAAGLPEGPVAVGLGLADFGTGRRACARTEVGLGVRGAGIIDTPNFYGNVGAQGVLFGSFALRPTTELFASLEAVSFGFTQNATLTTTQLTFGHLTAGATQVVYGLERLTGAITGRLLLPTSFEVPGMRLVGAEVGHTFSFRPNGWLEVHGAVGAEVTAAVGAARSDPRFGGFLLGGASLQPVSWFAFVLDVTGRVGRVSSLAPAAGLRFRIASFGIDVGGTLPVVGNDRHDFAATARFSWRF
ncbi:MAG: hypothetical protein MUC96_04580 [Myxococcaceae bacterium]|jgi:hypothetical protein|nr:hypothetical protein [Myxococcaceae bacterium]